MQTKLLQGLLDKITVAFILFFIVAYVVGMVVGQPTEEAPVTSETVPTPAVQTESNTTTPAVEVPSAQPTKET